MAHTFVCTKCGRQRVCAIAGCQQDCVPVCVLCLRGKSARPKQPKRKGEKEESYG